MYFKFISVFVMVYVMFFVKSIDLRLLLAGKKLTGYFTRLLCREEEYYF